MTEAAVSPRTPPEQAPARLSTGAGVALALVSGTVLLLALCVVSAVAVAVVVPNLQQAGRRRNEQLALEALEEVARAQARFRAEDADQDGVADFADLAQLGATGLLDPVLACGIKDGYVFEVGVSSTAPDERWMAIASPLADGQTGERHFAINQAGAVHYRLERPILLDLDRCDLPPDAPPVGAGYEPRRR